MKKSVFAAAIICVCAFGANAQSAANGQETSNKMKVNPDGTLSPDVETVVGERSPAAEKQKAEARKQKEEADKKKAAEEAAKKQAADKAAEPAKKVAPAKSPANTAGNK